MKFAELAPGTSARVTHVGGQGSYRRRLMELGILPGTDIRLVSIAPLGDPLELLVRGASLSIRRAEAEQVDVTVVSEAATAPVKAPARPGQTPPTPVRGTR